MLVFAGVFARAVWLQGVQAGTLEEMALRQQRETDTIPAGRGTIYDHTGEPLAIGEQATTVFADPRQVKDPRAVAVAAARILRVDPNALYKQLADRSKHFVYIKRKADPELAEEMRKKNLAGVAFYSEERRTYPQRGVAAHVLGFAGLDNDGLDGLEKGLDPQLVGKPGSQTIIRDPIGRAIDVVEVKPERQGDDVYLTIDHRLQANAEEVLREAVEKVGRARRARHRARAADRPRARDGGRAGVRREQLRQCGARAAQEPRRDGRVRARLDVQGRHRRGGPVGEARHADDTVHCCGTRFRSPTA